jgi:hypothetical protein
VIGARGVAADAEGADQLARRRVERQPAAEDVDPAALRRPTIGSFGWP